jgi:hypothetical protein
MAKIAFTAIMADKWKDGKLYTLGMANEEGGYYPVKESGDPEDPFYIAKFETRFSTYREAEWKAKELNQNLLGLSEEEAMLIIASSMRIQNENESEMISVDEEAEYATCETCNTNDERDNGIECEGCGGWYCMPCWKGPQYGKNPHFCGRLTTSTGLLVAIGDLLVYPLNSNIYQVVDSPETFIKNMICYATLKGDRETSKRIVRPRLMNHKWI